MALQPTGQLPSCHTVPPFTLYIILVPLIPTTHIDEFQPIERGPVLVDVKVVLEKYVPRPTQLIPSYE
jgi:hypothetical protein